MVFFRSFLFQVIYLVPTLIFAMTGLGCLVLPQRFLIVYARFWLRCTFFLLKHVQGLDYRVEGVENLPKGPFIVASKHQSVFETFVYPLLFDHPLIILKKELMYIPFWGWLLRKYEAIPINRSKPKEALKIILKSAEKGKATNRPLLIFPEGTRTKPGVSITYQSGIGILYEHLNIPVVPIALNTGFFWGRRRFTKRPGTATIKILKPIQPGLNKKIFMEQLHQLIESESLRLFKMLESKV